VGNHVVVRNIERAEPASVEKLERAGVATVHEAAGRSGLLDPTIRPVIAGTRVAGTAVTVASHPGDNLMVHLAVECLRTGDVLVVTTTSASTDGMIGELLAISMSAHGARGAVTQAGVRDVAELREMRFPVWSRAISAQGTVKMSPGSVNVPVVCGGQLVNPGDVIVADDDGVVCVPRVTAAATADAAMRRIDRESDMRARLADGQLGADLYNLRGRAADLGIEYIDAVVDR
jgi:4-hydroxy-4-methyl-2-oxoglutarate aldolase